MPSKTAETAAAEESQGAFRRQATIGTHALFGAAAVRLGVATPEDVVLALEEQARRRALGERRLRIGALMKEMGLITEEQLSRVLHELERGPLLLSEEGVQLAGRVKALHAGDHNVLVVTGMGEGDGASTAAAQIGVALALMEQESVLLVDANMRAPRLHSLFSVDPTPGLLELIQGLNAPGEVSHPTAVPGLRVVPSGNLAVDFLALLISSECADALARLRQQYRYLLIDTAPILQYADSAIMAARSDGVLLALAAGRRTADELREAQETLQGLSVPLSGVILTAPERGRRGLGQAGRGGPNP